MLDQNASASAEGPLHFPPPTQPDLQQPAVPIPVEANMTQALPRPPSIPQPPILARQPEWWRLLSLPLLLFLALPLISLILRIPPGQLLANLNQPEVLKAVSLSFVTTLITTVITIIFGTPVAFLLARRQFRFRRVVDTLLDLPTVLPPAVAGVALLMAFGRRSFLGGLLDNLGIQIAFTQTAVILAQLFVASPFFIKSAIVGFRSIEAEIEQAAALDGAGGWQIFRLITVPLAWTALLSGSVMTWSRALGEFGATIIFAGNYPGRTQTMPLAIYLGFELELNVALTLSVILICCSFLVLMVVKGLFQREIMPESGL